MRRVHVAHLEAGPLTGQATRAQRREAPLVGDLRQRIGLVHELRQLRAAEELTDRGGDRLGVDQIVRHRRVDLDRAHPLAHRALHAQEPDAELILHQLAHRAHPAIAEIVDVVDLAATVLDLDHVLDDGEDVLVAQHTNRVVGLETQTLVHLHPADRREIVALGVEEQPGEQRLGRLQGRRLTGAQHPVDVEQRLLAHARAIERQRVADIRADRRMIDVEQGQLVDADLRQLGQQLVGQLVAGLGMDQPALHVDDVTGDEMPDDVLDREVELGDVLFLDPLDQPRAHLGAGLGQALAGGRVHQIVGQLLAEQPIGAKGDLPALPGAVDRHLLVELGEQLLAVHAECEQQRRRRQLAAPVDAHIDEILGVELEVEPGAAIGDDAGRVEELARAVRLATVVVEEHAR